MNPALKILLGVVAVVLVIVAGSAVAVLLLFDPKDYQPLLESSVEKATGRKLTLGGELGLDLFPCCSVTLGPASLGNPPGFPPGEFAKVERAALSIKVWPLLTRRDVKIGVVRLDGLDANLLARADGSTNWTFDEGEDETPAAPGEEGATDGELAIEGIEISDGRLSYRDEQSGSAWLVENLELGTGDIAPGAPFDFTAAAKLTDQTDGTTATVASKGQATLDADTSRITLAGPTLDVSAAGESLPAKQLTAKLGAAEVTVDAQQELRAAFRGLEGEFGLPGLTALAGDLEGSFVAGDGTFVTGASSELTLPKLTADFTVRGADIPGDTITTRLQASGIAMDVDKMLGAVEGLQADINGLGAQLAVTGAGRLQESGATMAGKLTLDPVSPRSLLAVLKEPEPETADPKALTRLAGSADWALGKDTLRLPKLDFRLDDTHLTGSLGLANFETPVTSFDLALDAIDLDRYLAPEAPEGAKGGTGTEAGTEAEDVPVELIRDLRLDGRVKIGQLVFAKAKIADMSASVRAADGRLRLDPLSARAYGGTYRGAVAIDATGEQAKVALDQEIRALQVGPVLRDLYQNDKLTGALTGSIRANGTGNSSEALVRSLAGNVAVNLADGAYLGTDLWHEIRAARARIRGDAPPPAPASPRTELKAMQLAGDMTNGVLRTDKLLAEIPFIRLTGTGGLDLARKTMDYALQAKVFETPTFEDGSKIEDLTGLTIPLTVKGAMDSPKVGVDLKGLAKGVATQKLKERILEKLGGEEKPAEPGTQEAAPQEGQTQEQKKESPRDLLKKGLRDLLKQPQQPPPP